MRFALGDNQHQTLIVAMYEGTEKLLNQDVSEFAVRMNWDISLP